MGSYCGALPRWRRRRGRCQSFFRRGSQPPPAQRFDGEPPDGGEAENCKDFRVILLRQLDDEYDADADRDDHAEQAICLSKISFASPSFVSPCLDKFLPRMSRYSSASHNQFAGADTRIILPLVAKTMRPDVAPVAAR